MKHIFAIFTLLTAIPLMGQNAKWISANEESVDSPNTWVAFRKDFDVGKVPSSANAKIAVDSKYWLWINGKLAVFEGGLKRGRHFTPIIHALGPGGQGRPAVFSNIHRGLLYTRGTTKSKNYIHYSKL